MYINSFVNFVKNHFPNNGKICEVGCYDGLTTSAYAEIIKQRNGKLYVVDWFKGCEKESESHYHGFRPNEKDIVLTKFTNCINAINCLDITTIYEGLFWEQAVKFEDNSLDIVFIDADHRYSGVKQDIEVYLPKVKIGGYLCGHDFDSWDNFNKFTQEELESQCTPKGHCGVIQAVGEKFAHNEIQLIGDTVWVYHKK